MLHDELSGLRAGFTDTLLRLLRALSFLLVGFPEHCVCGGPAHFHHRGLGGNARVVGVPPALADVVVVRLLICGPNIDTIATSTKHDL